MIPVYCQVSHDPERGRYGDCIRACVATILDAMPDDVPHCWHDNPEPMTGFARLNAWLSGRGLQTFVTLQAGENSLSDVLDYYATVSPFALYILIGTVASGGGHAVVCRGGTIVHNPSWGGGEPLAGPVTVQGQSVWQIVALAKS